MSKYCRRWSVSLVLTILAVLVGTSAALAQSGVDEWDAPVNVSNTESISDAPFVLADQTGVVHLFWTEGVGGSRENPINGNTVMYSSWNGTEWSKPIDILISPQRGPVSQPYAVIDDLGVIHLFWIGDFSGSLYYSTAHAGEAGSATSWTTPQELDNGLSGTQYSMAAAFESPNTLHVAYAKGNGFSPQSESRTIAYIRSVDGGQTWESERELSSFSNRNGGGSSVRTIVAPQNKAFVTWSEWDFTGNGQAVYLVRSTDNGASWEPPVIIGERDASDPLDYERDWPNVAVLDDTQLAVIWEGGVVGETKGALRMARYSQDEGETWSAEARILPLLIGENGFSQFVYDGAGRTHQFVAQRGAGSPIASTTIGLWHSAWQGSSWSDPQLVGGVNPQVYPSVTIAGGNRVVAAWTSSTHFEIMVLTGKLGDAPAVAPEPWPTRVPPSVPTPSPTPETSLGDSEPDTGVASPIALSREAAESPPVGQVSPSTGVVVGIVPSVLLLLALVVTQRRRR